MNRIPVYPRLVSKVRRSVEKFETTHGQKPNAVLLGTDMLGAIVEQQTVVGCGPELSCEGPNDYRLDGLAIIPDGRKPDGVAVALVE